jgi:short chain dehydrogenase
LIARGIDGLEAAKREIESAGGSAVVLPFDVADATAMEKAAASVEHEFGPIDIWVNNAMASVFSPVTEMHPEEYKRVTEVRYLGVVYGTLAALKQMLPRDRGTIVQVGSALVYRSIPLQSAYCAAKHAIAGFSDSLRCELIHDKRRVGHDGPDARFEYATIWMGQKPPEAQSATCPADLPAGGWCKGDLLGGTPQATRGTNSLQVGSTAIWGKLDLHPNKPASRKIPTGQTIYGSR